MIVPSARVRTCSNQAVRLQKVSLHSGELGISHSVEIQQSDVLQEVRSLQGRTLKIP